MHFSLFGLVVTHSELESYAVDFVLGSLLCEECSKNF